ncbi:NAD(P) transhydrogenase subunit alpha [Kineosporia sp. NBRC 101731]|nr:Re/Si-specific NAD(P)(+) transhydrogenase subunit alpha [Kineosporia sp. NBRC 101731]GLY30365.1 NAD(P) transhydrogenase subunit alpha [Kineosporia sp. NBRC 101731]
MSETPPPLRIGVVAESAPGETRVAATPKTVEQLVVLGYDVLLETGAGALSSFSDEAFARAGARVTARPQAWDADLVLKVNAPTTQEIARLHDGATLVSMIAPARHPELLEQLATRHLTVLAMDAVPRISRAQSLDVLSSMANIAGYRAVIEAANLFGRFFTGQVTAAGKVPPAKVLVAGAGVAGLAAIGTASSLGAVVRATDPRPEVAEQVGSLGGTFLPVLTEDADGRRSSDGYARATSSDYDARAEQLYAEQAADVDIVITTALIPGRPAPRLLTAAHVASMRPGSVIVDMAAAQGGNVEGTRAGEVVVTENGVSIVGYTDLVGRLPTQASQLFGTNLVNLMKLLTPGKDGQLVLDLDDVVQRSMTVVRDGTLTWPPPPVEVSAAPVAATAPEPVAVAAPSPRGPGRTYATVAVVGTLLFLLAAFSPAQLIGNLTVFALAVVIGYYVIGQVHHALHTPLMSVTNAISGIIVVGALLQIGHDDLLVTALAALAVFLASVNIFGGFAVTRRMLGMFSKG